MTSRIGTRCLLLALALLLGGCTGVRLVESTVQASTPEPADPALVAGASYRFERLPSQTYAERAAADEAAAETELARHGLVRDEAGARYSVQLQVRLQSYLADDWGQPLNSSGMHGSIMFGAGNAGGIFGLGLGMRFPPPTRYRIDLTLLMRELASGRVVYEASAHHEGPWNDRAQLLRAVLQAALQDFPQPPSGERRISIELKD